MLTQIDLDNPKIYKQFDPDNMLEHLINFPKRCGQAWKSALAFKLPKSYAKDINKIVVLGMGGSAIGADLVNSLISSESSVPILTCREYNLPAYVDAKTLVIASSYSGATEETLSAFEQAMDTPAKKLAITTGGKLKTICDSENIPVFTFDYKSQPRAALPYSFFILLGILQNLGITADKSPDVAETIEVLNAMASKIGQKVPSRENTAKSLAGKLFGRLAVIYGAGVTAEVAHRWKTQINENSKAAAYYEVFSELNHNAIVGYDLPEEISRQSMVVMLESDYLHERIKLRSQITGSLLEQAGIYYQTVSGQGESPLSQMMSLVLFGDYVSYYLAMLNQVDPTPVKPIQFLKNELAKNI